MSLGTTWDRALRVMGLLFLVMVALLATLVVLRVPLLTWLGDNLLVADDPLPSDVAVALGGGHGERAREAARLYQEGLVTRVIVTGTTVEIPGLSLTWADLMAAHIAEMVPDSCLIKEPRSTSTYEDALYTREDLEAMGAESAIIVTDPYHLRRTRATFKEVFAGSDIRLLFVPPADSWFHAEGWWRSEDHLIVVTQEYLKMLYYIYAYGIWPTG